MSGDHTLAAAISAVEDVTKEPGVNESTTVTCRGMLAVPPPHSAKLVGADGLYGYRVAWAG